MHVIKAVALIFIHNDKVFIIKRQNSLRVFPGYHSFPGGKVDQEDYRKISKMPDVSDWENPFINALNREVFEEVGVSLEELFNEGIIERPKMYGVAASPEFNPYKYETFYYLLKINSEPIFKLEKHEIEYGKWATPDEVLEEYRDGMILCVPPFIKILNAIKSGTYPIVHDLGIFNFGLIVDNKNEIPMIEPLYEFKHFFVESITLPPAYFTNCFLVDGILVDPSPKDSDTYKKLIKTLSKYTINKIFITHHHRDHLGHADKLAVELNVPILMSERTHYWIEKRRDDFKNCEIIHVADNEVIGKWLGRNICVQSIPGHDDGHLALHSSDYQWFIAGDLFQFGATVVVGDEEGDMGVYQQTLQRVIDLSPNVIFPSHGIGVYGVNRLEKTLKHTKMRNKQVKDLRAQGHDIEGILSIAYKGISKKLHKYAKKNIISHLELLDREEQ